MSFETKVGLLVGIGFIVCFALVLSHRGRGDQISARMAYNVLAQHGRRDVTRATTIPNAFARFTGNRRRTGGFVGKPSANQRTKADVASPSNRVLVRREATVGPSDHDQAKRTSSRGAATEDEKGSRDVSDEPAWTWDAIFGGSDETTEPDRKARGDRRLPAGDETSGAPGTKTEKLDFQQPARLAPAVAIERYVVKPHDTLWRVAKKMYGKATTQNVQAIFDANRDHLSTASGLSVGVELRVPGLGKSSPGGGESRQRPARPSVVPRERQGDVPQYYDVRQGDRYASIAERLLGDKSRWHEIHELNKDIFPDPGKIRYGVRIRIPASRSVSQ